VSRLPAPAPRQAATRGALQRACVRAMGAALALAAASASCASLSAVDAAGSRWHAISDPADGAQGYLLEHLAAGGQLDVRFGRGGRRPIAISATDDAPTSLRVDARGRIWVAGASIAGGQPQAVILRYLADGTPDLQWGVQGRMQVSPGGLAVKPNDLLPLSDGSLLVAGVAANLEPVRAVVFHLKADGALDTAFGAAGTWQRVGASDGSTATHLAANDVGAVAVCVAARGDKPAAEIWSVTTPAPKLVLQQPLAPASDGEDLRAAWAGQRWVVVSAAGPTIAGQFATLAPVAGASPPGGAAAASAPSDPGQGGFSPFAANHEDPAPATTGDSGDDKPAQGLPVIAIWASALAAIAIAVLVALRARRRATRTVLRQRRTY